jgi:succinate dehydrogenase/fumarate reductase cytochrome b subunit
MSLLNKILLLALFSLFLLFSGCATYKRCVEKYKWKSDTIRTVIYRDTIIPILIHGTDTVYAWSTIRDTLIVHSGSAHAQSYIVHDTLRLNVWQSDTILKIRLDSAIKIIDTRNTQIVTIKEKARAEKILWQIIAVLGIVFFIVLLPRIIKKKQERS